MVEEKLRIIPAYLVYWLRGLIPAVPSPHGEGTVLQCIPKLFILQHILMNNGEQRFYRQKCSVVVVK
jgi:hypothetical protein